MRYSAIYVLVTLLWFCGQGNAANIELRPFRTYVIGGISDIQQVYFNDLDMDNNPEILIWSADKLVLYSPTLDSVLYSRSLEPAACRQCLFVDVNRDEVPDIVEGSVPDEGESQKHARVTILDGLYLWLGSPQSQVREFDIAQVPVWTTGMLGLLAAEDINQDGKKELILSYDTAYASLPWMIYDFGGHTRCYYSFPESLLWVKPRMFTSLNSLGGGAWLTSEYGGTFVDMMGMSYGFSWNLFIYDAINSIEERGFQGAIDKAAMTAGGSYTSYYPKCVGNLMPSVPGTEVLVSYSRATESGPPDYTETYASQLRMYNFVPPDSLAMVWQTEGQGIPANVLFYSGISGYFLGFMGNTLNLYRGVNGSILFSTAAVPSGRRSWCSPFDNGRSYLAVMNADTISLYSLSLSTAADGEKDAPIPGTLAVRAPYPNPFNSVQTIPITAKRNSAVTVDIYNLLGQKLTRIYEGHITSEQFTIQWDAGQLPSGIYLIRATSDGETATVKSVLLK